MAYEQHNMTGYVYPEHQSQPNLQTDENRNENDCGNKEICPTITRQSSGTQTVQKVDASTMTDPLQIDFKLTSEYLAARCAANNSLIHNCQEIRPKIEYDVKSSSHGMLIYHCPECAYRFEDRETLHEHLEDHRQRSHICDICGASLKRKEHLDRHKQGHNKDRPYQCSMCCKSFKRNEHLARHVIIHSGSKNQICTECGKAFFRKDHLKKHLQSHNNSNKNKNVSNNQNPPSGQNGLNNFALMMRQAGPSPFSILRT
ncbi:zinc finger protein 530-like [Leptopilina heterotoma]|uniref:zinc finger protein 530-like n=1 Tax=Leptopilina heterotoma TaxID=63436 RepID=UPI001CA8263C|nr:zinc finger protein 530-like [Leptopilina heterotoma]